MVNSEEQSQRATGQSSGGGDLLKRNWAFEKALSATNFGLVKEAGLHLYFSKTVLIWFSAYIILIRYHYEMYL
jgi:hypothetical protein